MHRVVADKLGNAHMRLGILAGYSGRHVSLPLDAIRHAEKLGYDSVWTSEACSGREAQLLVALAPGRIVPVQV